MKMEFEIHAGANEYFARDAFADKIGSEVGNYQTTTRRM